MMKSLNIHRESTDDAVEAIFVINRDFSSLPSYFASWEYFASHDGSTRGPCQPAVYTLIIRYGRSRIVDVAPLLLRQTR